MDGWIACWVLLAGRSFTGGRSNERQAHIMHAPLLACSLMCYCYPSSFHLPFPPIPLHSFTEEVAKIVRRGGRCLLPVFALGRAQELMLILDEFWHAHKDLHKVG